MSSNKNKNKLVDFIVKQFRLISDKILIVTINTEAYTITSKNCILIPELKVIARKLIHE